MYLYNFLEVNNLYLVAISIIHVVEIILNFIPNKSNCLIDGTLTGIITPDLSRPGDNGNANVTTHTPQR